MSQDINADADLWKAREEIGEKSLSIWLEFLSIANRNKGYLPGDHDQLIKHVAYKCRSTVIKVSAVWDFGVSQVWIKCDPDARVAKWAKYNKTRVANKPVRLDETRLDKTRRDIQTTSAVVDPDFFSVKDLVESWNEIFKGKLPSVQWPLSPSRQRKAGQRLKEHSLIDFWQQVFNNIGTSAFLLGSKNGTWRCTLDFLIANDSNCLKIYEGAYNGKTHA